MKHNSTKQKEITKRRLIIARLFNEGNTNQHQLVDILKEKHQIEVTQQTISLDLKALDQQWKEEARTEIDLVKGRLIAKYEQIYNEAFNAWLKSLKPAITKEKGTTDKGSFSKTKRVGQSGNPALLGQAQSALKSIREILGVDAPIKVDWREQLPDGFSAEEVQQQFIGLMQMAADNGTSD